MKTRKRNRIRKKRNMKVFEKGPECQDDTGCNIKKKLMKE